MPIYSPVRFPQDQSKHRADYEWWYAHGYLTNEQDHHYGFMFSFFKFDKKQVTRFFPHFKIYPGHIIYQLHQGFSDISARQHLFYQQTFVPRLGHVGFGGSLNRKALAFFGHNRLVQAGPKKFDLQLRHRDREIHLHLFDQKGVVLHGRQGNLSIKGQGSTQYYSYPRLKVEGRLDMRETEFVHGSAWIDHQWGNLEPRRALLFWTWLAVQLEDQRELMVFKFFDDQGVLKGSNATLIDRGKKVTRPKVQLTPIKNWTNPKSGTRYPIDYTLKIPSLKIDLQIIADLPDQEMTSHWFPYWEGACSVLGQQNKKPLRGKAYLEQTGFSQTTPAGLKKRLAPVSRD